MSANSESYDPIKPWFVAGERLNEYIGIRFGHIPPGEVEPEWIYVRHSDFDGIGGFAEILRRRGAVLTRLPQIKYPSSPSIYPLIRALPKFLSRRRPIRWQNLPAATEPVTNTEPPRAAAWHAFSEHSTVLIRRACRKSNVTVNSFLVKHLTKSLRPFLRDESTVVPWMLPVNLRGKITRDRDTANHSSYIGLKVCSFETVQDVHRNIYDALSRGEHWANWFAYQSGRLLGEPIKQWLIRSGRCMPEYYLGGFSNLGDWDSERQITQSECEGVWLFSPPVLRCQVVGAGCVTFQNRLSLLIQLHPELTTDLTVPRQWVAGWVKEIELDLASMFPEVGVAKL